MIIIQDNQEKIPWNFAFYGIEQITKSLNTGDYTLQGYEDVLCIERKSSTGELANNIGMKWAPFKRELERMYDFPEKYLICEFPESNIFNFPLYSTIPKSAWPKMKITANFLCSRIALIQEKYNITVLFADDKFDAEKIAINIFKEIINKYERN